MGHVGDLGNLPRSDTLHLLFARPVADDERVTRTFRDGIAWVDSSRDPEKEVTRLRLAMNPERGPAALGGGLTARREGRTM